MGLPLTSERSSHTANEQLALVDELFGEVALEIEEEFFVREDLGAPGSAVKVL